MTCEAGSFSSSPGQTVCELCPAGYQGPQPRASSRASCTICPAGMFSLSGARSCLRCAAGSFSSKAGSGSCELCDLGTYSDIGGECFECPGVSYSMDKGSTSLNDCSAIRTNVERRVVINIGITIFLMYSLSFAFVPLWSSSDKIWRLQMCVDHQGRLQEDSKSKRIQHKSSWFDRIKARFSSDPRENVTSEKRFFNLGDVLLWEADGAKHSNVMTAIGTVEGTTVYPDQDADEIGTFDVFLKVDDNFHQFQELCAAVDSASESDKPFLVDSKNRSCRCQLLKAPTSHLNVSLLGFKLGGSWAIIRQANACLQLFLMSVFPAVDTITDLMYILDSVFKNSALFALSIFFLTSQFWLFIWRLYRRRVLHAFLERTIELSYVKGLSFWPKWASPDNLFVFFLMIVPFYVSYYIIFPVVWFFLGYAMFSFQLFPISRISNRWLYAFVYVVSSFFDLKS